MADPSALFGVDLVSIRDRLSALSFFNTVSDLQDAAQAMGEDFSFLPPAAFVSVSDESFEPNRYATGGHGQRATVTISVLMCLPEERAAEDQTDVVEQAGKGVIAQLVAWKPVGAQKGLEVASRRVRAIENGLIWLEVLFRTSYDLSVATAAP